MLCYQCSRYDNPLKENSYPLNTYVKHRPVELGYKALRVGRSCLCSLVWCPHCPPNIYSLARQTRRLDTAILHLFALSLFHLSGFVNCLSPNVCLYSVTQFVCVVFKSGSSFCTFTIRQIKSFDYDFIFQFRN